jgi:hypothetical protein
MTENSSKIFPFSWDFGGVKYEDISAWKSLVQQLEPFKTSKMVTVGNGIHTSFLNDIWDRWK